MVGEESSTMSSLTGLTQVLPRHGLADPREVVVAAIPKKNIVTRKQAPKEMEQRRQGQMLRSAGYVCGEKCYIYPALRLIQVLPGPPLAEPK